VTDWDEVYLMSKLPSADPVGRTVTLVVNTLTVCIAIAIAVCMWFAYSAVFMPR